MHRTDIRIEAGSYILYIKDDDIYIFVACGMAVFDVAWGYDVYRNALEKGIGQKLLVWDEPALG